MSALVEGPAGHGTRLGVFGPADLPQAGDFSQIIAALAPDADEDMAFVHLPAQAVAQTPEGLRRGVNLFGPGESPEMTASPRGVHRTREIASVLLNDAAYVASSMSVIDREQRLFTGAIENLGDPRHLAGFDSNFHLDADGALCLSDGFRATAQHIDAIALPVCGPGFPNYGHFLHDGLPAIFLQRHLLRSSRVRVVGQRLSPWQHDILAALDLDGIYFAVTEPVVFRKLLATTMLSLHVSYPTAFIRPMFDFLRFRFGAPPGQPRRRVFLSRGDTGRRVLRNRAEVEGALARLGLEIVHPERLSFAAQVALLASCRTVVGESGAALANLGFAQPGTNVLEIQPERFTEGWTRANCFMLGHRWHVYFARVDSPPQVAADGTELDPRQVFSYEIDADELVASVQAVEA